MICNKFFNMYLKILKEKYSAQWCNFWTKVKWPNVYMCVSRGPSVCSYLPTRCTSVHAYTACSSLSRERELRGDVPRRLPSRQKMPDHCPWRSYLRRLLLRRWLGVLKLRKLSGVTTHLGISREENRFFPSASETEVPRSQRSVFSFAHFDVYSVRDNENLKSPPIIGTVSKSAENVVRPLQRLPAKCWTSMECVKTSEHPMSTRWTRYSEVKMYRCWGSAAQ